MFETSIKRSQVSRGQWAFLSSRAPVVLLAGGFGAGKTLGLGLKVLQLKAANPGVPGLLMAQTWRALWSVTVRRLMGFLRRSLPKRLMPRIKDRTGECYLDFGDGVPVFLRSAHDESSFDGLDVGWACGDEARHWPVRSHEVLLGRVRIPCPVCQIAYASTPAMNWLDAEFNCGRPNRELVTSPTQDNARNLAPGFIENLRLSYSKRMWKAVVEGRFTVLEGAVYEAFDGDRDSPWMVDHKFEPHLTTCLAVDPGFRRSAWLWVQETTDTSWCVYDELMPDNTSDDACVQMVNDRDWPIDEIWVDPAAEQTQSTFNLDTIAMVKAIKARSRAPIRYIVQPFNRVAYGVDKLRTLLGDPAENQPIRITFDRGLVDRERTMERGIIKNLSAYRYQELRDDKPVSDVPLKDGLNDHGCDALRQLAVGKWLSSPLRGIDERLKKLKERGYRIVDR